MTDKKNWDNNLDYTFKKMNDIGDNIHDEIFIFFNYLFVEDNITELINFFSSQAAKTMKT